MIDTGDNALKLEVVKIIENSVTENNTTHIELERLLKTLASEKDNEIKNHAERALRIMEGIKKRKN